MLYCILCFELKVQNCRYNYQVVHFAFNVKMVKIGRAMRETVKCCTTLLSV